MARKYKELLGFFRECKDHSNDPLYFYLDHQQKGKLDELNVRYEEELEHIKVEFNQSEYDIYKTTEDFTEYAADRTIKGNAYQHDAVSYTHLTLPTNREV